MSEHALSELILDEPVPGVVRLRFNRPEVLNAINTAMGNEIVRIYCDLATRPDLVCLILTGTGRAFSVGADLKERAGMDAGALRQQHMVHRLGLTIRQSFEFPVIAAVNGLAHGGGAEIALAADIVLAVPGARFRLPEVHRGIMPGMGGTQFLTRAVGRKRALEWLIEGTDVDAEGALASGLINRIVPKDTLEQEALAIADRIASAPPLAVRAITRSVRSGAETELGTGLALELALHQRLLASDDRREGIAAFVEGRDPDWSGK